MKIPITIKSILSQPLRTLLFILLIGAVTFGFTLRAFEGIIVYKELNRLEDQYHAIGQLVPLEDWEWCVSHVQSLLEESSLVADIDSLRVIQGVMDGVYSPDIDAGTPYINQMFVYGTLLSKEKLDLEFMGNPWFSHVYYPYLPYVDVYLFELLIDTVETSLPEYVEVGETKQFFLVDYRGTKAHVYQEAQVGQRYFVGLQYSRNLATARWWNQLFFLPLSPQPHEWWYTGTYDLLLIPLGQSGEIFLYPVSEHGRVNHPEILEQIDVLRENIHTVFLRPSRDLITNPLATSSLVLLEGRFINEEDHENENPVAMIRGEFARIRGLELGDRLSITMREGTFAIEHIIPDAERSIPVPSFGQRMTAREFEVAFGVTLDAYTVPHIPVRAYGHGHDPAWTFPRIDSPHFDGFVYEGMFFPDCRGIDEIIGLEMTTGYLTDLQVWQNWQELETVTREFEIVGIYATTDRLTNLRSVSYNNVFVPDSVVPAHWLQDVLYRNFSFTLHSPADEELFIFTYQDLFEELGFWTVFLESGWSSFNGIASPMRAGILAGAMAFLTLTMIIFRLATYLFFISRRKEYAIRRALGASKVKALAGLFTLSSILGAVGILIGIVFAWFFAKERAENLLAGLEGATFTPLPLSWLLLMFGLILAFFATFALLETHKLRGLSEIELLQNNPEEISTLHRMGKKTSKYSKKSVIAFMENSLEKEVDHTARMALYIPDFHENTFKSHGSTFALGAFLSKHILRRKVRTLLTVMIASGFVIVLSFMETSIQNDLDRVDWLYDNTIIGGTIVIDPSVDQTNIADGISSRLLRSILRLEYHPHSDEIIDLEILYDNTEEGEGIRFIYSYATETSHRSVLSPLSLEELTELEEIYRGEWGWEWLFESPEILFTTIVSFNDIQAYESFHGESFSFHFIEGYDEDIFSKPFEDEMAILLSSAFMEESNINLGDCLKIAPSIATRARNFTTYTVIGSFEVGNPSLVALVPLGHLQEHVEGLSYHRLSFEVNPDFNRKIDTFKEEIAPLLTHHEPSYLLVLRDHVLRGVIVPLEQNIAMMNMLYPILLTLAAFISAGLTVLLLLSVIKQATIMRVLGMSKSRIITGWIAEQGFLCLLGVGFGTLISLLAFGGVSLPSIVIYLSGSIVASLVFMLLLIRQQPLELLQMRE